MLLARFCFILAFAMLAPIARASEPAAITWDTLAPQTAKIENPFDALTSQQLDNLRQILRFEAQAEQSDEDQAGVQAAALRDELTKDGIDVEAMFQARLDIMEDRQAASTAVNEDLVGTKVRLPGYILPLAFKDRKAVEFLLVPTVGACIHTPAPPANQIVHVVYPEGIEIDGMFTPVWVSGEMQAERSVQNVGYSDGQSNVSVSYTMQPDDVLKYSE